MVVVTEVFQALSDPTRMEMVARLVQGESFTLGEISSNLGITRQGARKHLSVLEQARLLHYRKEVA